MKKAYKRIEHFNANGWYWEPVELTGLCKKVTGGIYEVEEHYYQAQSRFLGIPIRKYWIPKNDVRFADPVVETIYECKCNE